MARTYPSDFDGVDRKMAKDLTPDDVFVTDMIVLIRWMDSDGQDAWRCYNATADNSLSAKIGLLEFGKVDLMQRCSGVFPQYVSQDEDDSE